MLYKMLNDRGPRVHKNEWLVRVCNFSSSKPVVREKLLNRTKNRTPGQVHA